jgi:hypothetical protein
MSKSPKILALLLSAAALAAHAADPGSSFKNVRITGPESEVSGGGTLTVKGTVQSSGSGVIKADDVKSGSAIETSIAGKQPLDSDLTAIAALTTTSFGRALLALASGNSMVLYTDGSGNWVLGNTLPAVSGANLTSLNASNLGSGTVPAARMPALTGDVTTSAGAVATTLANTGVSAGTYRSVTVDAKGRVLDGTNPTTVATSGLTDAVAGPASATDTAFARYSGTTGKIIQNSQTTEDSAGNVTVVGRVTMAGIDQQAANELREGRDYVYSDGATSNRAAVWSMGPVGNLAGAASATWRGTVTWPTSFPAGHGGICALYSSATPTSDAAHLFRVVIYSAGGGTLEITQFGATSTDFRSFLKTGMVAAYGGQTGTLEIAFTQGTTNPVVRWNNVDISSGFTASTGGTPPTWLDSGMICTYATTGLNWPAGRAPIGCWINGTLSSSDRTFWRQHGRPPFWVPTGGSMVAAYTSDFSAGANGFDANTSNISVAGNVDAIGGVDDTLQLLAAAGAYRTPQIRRLATLAASPARYRVSLDVYKESDATAIYIGVGVHSNKVSDTDNVLAVDNTWTHVVAEFNNAGNDTTLYISGFAGSTSSSTINLLAPGKSLYFKNFRIEKLGALALSTVQPCQVLDDATGNGQCGLLTPGMTPVTPRKDFRIVARTSTNGNQQLLGGALFSNYTTARITSWVVANNGAGSRTISLGQASAGAQYLSGGTAAVGNTDVTLLTRLLGSSAFWCSSDGTDELVHTIIGTRFSK